jgi:hypothetical protein
MCDQMKENKKLSGCQFAGKNNSGVLESRHSHLYKTPLHFYGDTNLNIETPMGFHVSTIDSEKLLKLVRKMFAMG